MNNVSEALDALRADVTLSVREAAEGTGVSYRTLYRRIKEAGDIPRRIPPAQYRNIKLREEGKFWCPGGRRAGIDGHVAALEDEAHGSRLCKACNAANTRVYFQTKIKPDPARYRAYLDANIRRAQAKRGSQ